MVYGPGHIEQAHAADEWVALDQLATAAATYHRLMENAR
jgi:acetylornithine deacetylase